MRVLSITLVCFCFLVSNVFAAEEVKKEDVKKDAAKPAAAEAKEPAAKAETEKKDAKPALPTEVAKAQKYIKQAQAALKRIKDFTATFYKKEYKDGELPAELTLMKWRRSPRSVYLKWVGKHKKNQEVIWQKGWNDNELRAHKGSFPDITVNLDVNGGMAMKDSRHPITDAGFDTTVRLIATDMEIAIKHPEYGSKITDLGLKKVQGAQSYCYKAEMDTSKYDKFYAKKAILCMHKTLKVPNEVKIWKEEDGKVRLIEHYAYKNIKVNVGLTDKDFDPENKEYNY